MLIFWSGGYMSFLRRCQRSAVADELSHVAVVSDVELGRLAFLEVGDSEPGVYKAEAPQCRWKPHFLNPPHPSIPDHPSEFASLYLVYDPSPFKMMWDLSGSRSRNRDRDRSIPSFPVPQPNNSQSDMRGYIPQLSPPTMPTQVPVGMSTYHQSTTEQQIQTYGRQQIIYTQGAQVVTVIQKSKHHHHKHHHSKHHHSSTPRPPILIQHSSPAAPQLNQTYPTAPVISLPYAQPQSYSQPNLPQSAHHPQPHIIQPNYITPNYQQADGQPFDTNHSPYSKCTGRRKALCIGINYLGQANELRGCVNDARRVREFLIRNHRFRKSDIVMLTDDSPDPSKLPTRSNILQAMKWLVRSGKPHDSLFFHYSGHGGQTPDLDGDEIDGFDEVIFPVDHQDKGHITDDTMHDIMVKPLPRNCRLTALFDCCHSGTALDLPYIYRTDGRVKKELVTPQARRRKSSPADVISFSGCEDGQTSADTFANGVAVGAMSHAFISVLRKNPRQSYQGLLAAVRGFLNEKYSQTPQLGSSHHIDIGLEFII
ncbi:peptidase C14B family protein [Pleurotus pulmonarius]